MMSKKIIDSDLFMDMPPSSQVLYFHLLLRADDEGFVGNTRNIMRLTNSTTDDYKILLAKRFIIEFSSGVCVIKHWCVHNYIQKDRFTSSRYIDEKGQLRITKDRVYFSVNEECTQTVYKLDTKISKDKDSLVKNSKKKEKILLPAWLDLDAWDMWLEYQNERNKPLSKKTTEAQLQLLDTYRNVHSQMIYKSIECGWSGLYAPDDYEE